MENVLRYGSSAKVFEEALPLGNGQLGAMVYGRTDKERISLNHDTLWSGKPGQKMVDTAYETNEKAKKMVITRIFQTIPKAYNVLNAVELLF